MSLKDRQAMAKSLITGGYRVTKKSNKQKRKNPTDVMDFV